MKSTCLFFLLLFKWKNKRLDLIFLTNLKLSLKTSLPKHPPIQSPTSWRLGNRPLLFPTPLEPEEQPGGWVGYARPGSHMAQTLDSIPSRRRQTLQTTWSPPRQLNTQFRVMYQSGVIISADMRVMSPWSREIGVLCGWCITCLSSVQCCACSCVRWTWSCQGVKLQPSGPLELATMCSWWHVSDPALTCLQRHHRCISTLAMKTAQQQPHAVFSRITSATRLQEQRKSGD